MVIQWIFGFKTKIKIQYKKNRDIPNHKEQLACVGSMSWSHQADHKEVKYRFNSYKRPCFYGFDTIVPTTEGAVLYDS